LPRAKQAFVEDEIAPPQSAATLYLSPSDCADFTNYLLAVTTFDAHDERRVTEIFGCMHVGGRQLSDQDRRQAGAVSRFNDLVRKISAKIRENHTRNPIDFRMTLSTSIEVPSLLCGSTIRASDVFWCKHSIAQAAELRQSADEQTAAGLFAIIILGGPNKNEKYDRDLLYSSDAFTVTLA
jgi:hypothetical protein